MKYIIIAVILLIGTCLQAQERSLVRKGNDLYAQKKYAAAADAYQKALQKQPLFVPGAFNLGNALIEQKQYDAARRVMTNAANTTKDPAVQSGAQYNTGNTFMSEQQWQQAVNAYKQSLRRNPQDADAKYNLSYALSKLKQQQQNKDKDKKGNQQQKKGEDKKDQKDQPQKDGEQKKEAPKPQPQQSNLSEQQADNMLKALQQDERKVQDKMQQSKASPVKLDKDW